MIIYTFKHKSSNNEFMPKLSIRQIVVHYLILLQIIEFFSFMFIMTNMHQKECNLLNSQFMCNTFAVYGLTPLPPLHNWLTDSRLLKLNFFNKFEQ